MKKLNIEITKAQLTGYTVTFNEDGLPNVSASIALLTENLKEVTTHTISTNSWRDEDKFELPLGMITPMQKIAVALEEVIVNHMRDSQLKLG